MYCCHINICKTIVGLGIQWKDIQTPTLRCNFQKIVPGTINCMRYQQKYNVKNSYLTVRYTTKFEFSKIIYDRT